MKSAVMIAVLFLQAANLSLLQGQTKEAGRLGAAATAFQEIMDTPDSSVPVDLLERSECIVIIPSMKKGGFILGGRYGKGVVSCRQNEGKGAWGTPAMVALGGGSFGLQIGVAAVDVVMLVMHRDGVNSLLKNKFTMGGDVSAAAGPVGRAGAAETDAYLKAKILSYSRSRGVFAGLELKGAVLQQDRDGNQNLYGKPVGAKDLLMAAQEPVPNDAKPLIDVLTKYSPARNRKPL
ncbi:MAG: lipid-binding SYLF domain-containing protein [Acidobacteria bacterium]|nr:lipid-binding SYLF domain-containing protein [Acidobacteriota bacterium]MCI0626263.1 lipid-binding SYLF domain-containing protein [Acidobacteriota bacterium]MCI0722983.1 lipid-binding SYLF domain-containing protein [Acidobacteriota bacterium]